MDRNVWIGFATSAVLASTMACGAPGERPEAIRQAADRDGDITVAGCLQREAQTGRFVLTSTVLAHEYEGLPVRDGTEVPPPAVGAPTTTGTVPPVLAGPRYLIEPPAGVNLQAHAGVQVQVTGRLRPDDQAARPVGTTGVDQQGTADAARLEPGIDGHIVASEVRLVADTCL